MRPIKLLYEFRDPIVYHGQLTNEIVETLAMLVFPLGMFAQQRGISEGMTIFDLANYYLLEIFLTLIPHAVYIVYNLQGGFDESAALIGL